MSTTGRCTKTVRMKLSSAAVYSKLPASILSIYQHLRWWIGFAMDPLLQVPFLASTSTPRQREGPSRKRCSSLFLGRNSEQLDITIKILSYNITLLQALTYGSTVWGALSWAKSIELLDAQLSRHVQIERPRDHLRSMFYVQATCSY